MNYKSIISLIVALTLFSFDCVAIEPLTHWFGTLKIKSTTYRLYLKYFGASSRLFILNPKANEIPLDTCYLKGNSLYFERGDFYSSFKGIYYEQSNTIRGIWTGDDHKKYPVTFNAVDPDTLTGLRPKVTKSFTWHDPIQRQDGLKTCALSATNIDKTFLDSLTLSIMMERYPNIHSLIIAKDGCLVYEDYFYGWKAEDIWLIQSVTKSFTSALAGIALSRGEIKGVDESICKYLTKYKKQACNNKNRSITIQQLLTMTTGLNWNELEFDYHDQRNTANQCGKAPDPFECLLSRDKAAAGTEQFSYNSMNHLMVNLALKESTSMKNAKELRERLLKPLGIEVANTGDESFGVIGDITISPRSMLKFGMLYLNDGVWAGKSVIPADWVKESTTSKVPLANGEGYGYFWWTKHFSVHGKVVDCYYAWGYGGQYIFVIPSVKAVVAMTASNWIMDEKKYAFEMMEKYILPSMSK